MRFLLLGSAAIMLSGCSFLGIGGANTNIPNIPNVAQTGALGQVGALGTTAALGQLGTLDQLGTLGQACLLYTSPSPRD